MRPLTVSLVTRIMLTMDKMGKDMIHIFSIMFTNTLGLIGYQISLTAHLNQGCIFLSLHYFLHKNGKTVSSLHSNFIRKCSEGIFDKRLNKKYFYTLM